MPGGPPPEFDGSDAWWSPEHLLLEAVNLCMMNTFCALAAKAGLKFESYRGHVDGTLEKTEQGIAFTSIKVRCEVKAEDKAKADQLLHSAKKYCIVSNALKIPPILETNVL
jgi:organic hydroperoxide reductase OsmC/OhrA